MKTICVAGKAQAGKDTVARLIRSLVVWEKPHIETKHTNLADSIKHDIYIDLLGNNVLNKQSPQTRKALQIIGGELRKVSDTVWLDIWLKNLIKWRKVCHSPNTLVLVSDIRYHNELKWFRHVLPTKIDTTVSIIKVVGRGGLCGAEGLHNSETELDTIPDSEYDYIIDNSGTFSELKATIKQLYEDEQLW